MIELTKQASVERHNPVAELRLYSGVPWDNTYQHVRKYSSKSDLLSHLEKWRVHPSTQLESLVPIRIGEQTIKVPFTEVKMLKVNYFAFCNHMYSESWVFGFVTGFKWISPHATEIYLEYDVYQNSIYEAKIQPCMVEWEHIKRSEDSNRVCRTSVNLDVGRMYCYATRNIETQYDRLCAYVTEGATGVDFKPQIVNNIMNSCAFWSTSLLNENQAERDWKDFLDAYDGNPDAIISAFVAPDICRPSAINSNKNNIETTFDYNLSKPFGGYVPKNKKLYSYPFISIVADNNQGNVSEFYFEDFSGGKKAKFRCEGALATLPQTITFPVDYNGVRYNYSESMVSNAYAMIGWGSDVFKAWQAQHANQNTISSFNNKLTAVTGAIGGAMQGAQSGGDLAPITATAGAIKGAWGGIYSDLQLSAQKDDMKRVPPQIHGKALSESINVGQRLNGTFFYLMCCRAEYAKKADAFFEKYGYPINQIRTPRTTTRKYWNYIKTSNCNFTGKIELNDLANLRAIYDRGVTIWHTDDIGNYSLSND